MIYLFKHGLLLLGVFKNYFNGKNNCCVQLKVFKSKQINTIQRKLFWWWKILHQIEIKYFIGYKYSKNFTL